MKQQALQKQQQEVGALQAHLREMQRFRLVLESELNDLNNKAKPEVKQVIYDLKMARLKIAETNEKAQEAQERVEGKRQSLNKLLQSGEMEKVIGLKIQKMNYERRLQKWSALMTDSHETLQSIEAFSSTNAQRRQSAVDSLKYRQKALIKKEIEVEDLENYASLIDAMVKEHQQNWS